MESQDLAVRGSPEPIEGKCAAKLRGTDPPRYCIKYPLQGRPRCELHGGLTPMGLDLPQTTNARRSKYLPAQLRERYEAFAADPKAVGLGEDLALLETRLTQLLVRLEDGESESGWKRARDAFTDLRGAMAEGDSGGVRSAMQRLQGAFAAATGVDATWRDVRELLQERRLLSESERRRMVDLHQMITVEELMLFMAKLTSIIQAEVTDSGARLRIGIAINAMLNAGGRAPRTVQSRVKAATNEPEVYSGGVRVVDSAAAGDPDDGEPIG